MSINTKKPAMKQTVGAQYMCFADATEGKEYDGTTRLMLRRQKSLRV